MNEIKLSDLARAVLANVDTTLRSGSKGSGMEGGADTGRKLPVAFINAARRAQGKSVSEEGSPKITMAIDRGQHK